MKGYIDNEEETANALRLHSDGLIWLHTGDIGVIDGDGFIYFKQRLKRLIVSSGYNIYPAQLENVFDAHEKVQMSCAIGVPDSYKMHKVKMFIMPAAGVEPNEETKKELLDYARKNIAKYALPYDIEFRDQLPKTLVGKVAYRELEEEELKKLKFEERPAIVNAISEARALGDLSENAEYHYAKDKQGFIEGRIRELESKLSRAEVIDITKLGGTSVKFGCTVTICDESNDEEVTYKIVGIDEADVKKNLLSVGAPLARAMIGKEAGDEIKLNTPSGMKQYEILEVKYI